MHASCLNPNVVIFRVLRKEEEAPPCPANDCLEFLGLL